MSYTKRQCYHCGYRDIQPNMRKVTITVDSGTSQKTMSKGSLVGSFLGDERSGKQNADSIFGVSKRKYKRNKEVYICGNCNDNGSRRGQGKIARTWRLIKSLTKLTWIIAKSAFYLAIVAFIFLAIQGGL